MFYCYHFCDIETTDFHENQLDLMARLIQPPAAKRPLLNPSEHPLLRDLEFNYSYLEPLRAPTCTFLIL